ncbi:MAG: EAL domain-containing protein [Candidatus Thiodiazotropha sp.]
MERYRNLSRHELEGMLAESEQTLHVENEAESQYVIHDLQQHKIELEIQNRDLKESQQELETIRDQYADLYDFSPVGYVSLDEKGTIKNLNLAAAAMFGRERSGLLGHPLATLLASGANRVLFKQLREAFSCEGTISCEFPLKAKSQESERYIRADSVMHKDANGEKFCLMNLIDTTHRWKAEQAIAEERTFLQHVIDGIEDPVLVVNLDYKVLRMNNAAKRTAVSLGLDPKSVHCYQVTHQRDQPCDTSEHPCPLDMVLKTHIPNRVVHTNVSETGVKRKYEVIASPLIDDDGQIVGIIETSHDVTEHLQLLDELKERELSYAHLAQHDSLTGLPNRLLFADRLSQAIHISHRHKTKFAVLFIDLDRFKEVNDSFDHACGDEVLKEVATRFLALFREEDTIARMGGDEFTVILTQLKHESNAAIVARKLLHTLKDPFEVQGQQLFLGASIGISIYPDHGETVDELVRNADSAMYQAKDAGRNTFNYYSEELTAKAVERVFLASSLHSALENKEFILHYQPQFDLISNQVIGVEALVRWQHPDMGLVAPNKFIPLAEETGMILAMGNWVLTEACQQMKLWQDSGLLTKDTTISVNLSGKQFDRDVLAQEIKQNISNIGLSPSCLEVEITETIMMRSTDVTSDTLSKLRQIGVKVAIDDFGTGYSSLNYLKQLPITRLKIDKSFISDIPTDMNEIAISRAIISMAKNLSLEVLAEGIETEDQKIFLINEGCTLGQGFKYARPMTNIDFESFIKSRCSIGVTE